ncbi:hypothetical protein [Nocardia crassostreae]|uniref:hypothetical protein n=1 Tax=Nocardia crassostreae TaxID=53428 RepID=UPI00083020A4|nr:hypothetical protein [Nocardia crassostreae]
MHGSNADADERGDLPLRRLPAPVKGAAAAVGVVSLGLVLIGSCGLGRQDTYVPPPPLNADLQAAPSISRSSGTTTPAVIIPPSPTWRVASGPLPRRTTTSTEPSTTESDAPEDADPSTSRTTRPRPSRTTTPETTVESPRPTTEPSTILDPEPPPTVEITERPLPPGDGPE